MHWPTCKHGIRNEITVAEQDRLDNEPWLEPFIEDDDTSLDQAIERYTRAQAAARAELRATGRAVYERMVTAEGYETTAVQTHPTSS